jgi:hypothetical protein
MPWERAPIKEFDILTLRKLRRLKAPHHGGKLGEFDGTGVRVSVFESDEGLY